MSRLARDIPATIAALRITGKPLTVFVESDKNDAFVYDAVCEKLKSVFLIDFEIRESREVLSTGPSGGKTVLLALLDEVRANAMLETQSSAGKKSVAFILDKDIDDLLGIARIERHLIYTPTYHCEDLLMIAGNLRRAIASAFSVSGTDLDSLCFDASGELKRISGLWIEWVKLCTLASRLKTKYLTNYSVPSRVNNPLSGQTDAAAVSAIRGQILTRSGLSEPDFAQAEEYMHGLVEALYAANLQDTVFKGTWYADVICDLALQRGLTSFSKVAFQKASLWAVLRATLDLDHAVFGYFYVRLGALVS